MIYHLVPNDGYANLKVDIDGITYIEHKGNRPLYIQVSQHKQILVNGLLIYHVEYTNMEFITSVYQGVTLNVCIKVHCSISLLLCGSIKDLTTQNVDYLITDSKTTKCQNIKHGQLLSNCQQLTITSCNSLIIPETMKSIAIWSLKCLGIVILPRNTEFILDIRYKELNSQFIKWLSELKVPLNLTIPYSLAPYVPVDYLKKLSINVKHNYIVKLPEVKCDLSIDIANNNRVIVVGNVAQCSVVSIHVVADCSGIQGIGESVIVENCTYSSGVHILNTIDDITICQQMTLICDDSRIAYHNII